MCDGATHQCLASVSQVQRQDGVEDFANLHVLAVDSAHKLVAVGKFMRSHVFADRDYPVPIRVKADAKPCQLARELFHRCGKIALPNQPSLVVPLIGFRQAPRYPVHNLIRR